VEFEEERPLSDEETPQSERYEDCLSDGEYSLRKLSIDCVLNFATLSIEELLGDFLLPPDAFCTSFIAMYCGDAQLTMSGCVTEPFLEFELSGS
jgi:hypothetical protein